MPWVRKVWIVGDRPAFLTDDTSVAEHVPQRYVARIGDFQTPVTNFFHMLFRPRYHSLLKQTDRRACRYFRIRPICKTRAYCHFDCFSSTKQAGRPKGHSQSALSAPVGTE